jgi:Ca2+-transporting ATPase
MTVRRLFIDGSNIQVYREGYQPAGQFLIDGKSINIESNGPLNLLLKMGALCNDALLTRNERQASIIGDPTEGALVVSAAKAGLMKEELIKSSPRLAEITFESEKQYMATAHRTDGRYVVYVKGSVEKILSFCKSTLKNNEVIPLEQNEIHEITRRPMLWPGSA